MDKLRLYVDIAHPAHAHALRHFIGEMKQRGHKVFVTARDKDVTQCLLTSWGVDFTSRGEGSKTAVHNDHPAQSGGVPILRRWRRTKIYSLSGKATYLAGITARLLPRVRSFGPDVIVSWCSYHAALIGRLLGKPVLTFEDTETVPFQNRINHLLSSRMITPACFEKDLGKKHIRFDGYKELASLHPQRFEPLPLPASVKKPYVLLRFVSWTAYHDRGHSGIGEEMKQRIAAKLSEFGNVYISSEIPLSPGLRKYGLPVSCDMVHSVLAGASLFLGESASMAAEAAVLGVPAIYIDDSGRGYTRELEARHGLLFSFGEDRDSVQSALARAEGLLGDKALLEKWQEKRMKMLAGKADIITWMAELAESAARGKLP